MEFLGFWWRRLTKRNFQKPERNSENRKRVFPPHAPVVPFEASQAPGKKNTGSGPIFAGVFPPARFGIGIAFTGLVFAETESTINQIIQQ
jgi:hypothetical protein